MDWLFDWSIAAKSTWVRQIISTNMFPTDSVLATHQAVPGSILGLGLEIYQQRFCLEMLNLPI